jgi:RNA-dependent RNA polymerase
MRADSSDQGIHDPACLALAALHSDAVDYPKTGMPVPLDRIPRHKSFVKPDWSCPEITISGNTKLYYESQRWLGRLFREITLPEPRMPRINSTSRSHNVSLVRVVEIFCSNKLYSSLQPGGKIIKAVRVAVSKFIDPWRHSKKAIEEIWKIFQEFAYELRTICASHTISSGRLAMLTEEEALVGTIVAKSSAPRRRKEQIASLREHTTNLFDRTARQIIGPPQRDEAHFKEHTMHSLQQAWVAYGISIIFWHSKFFGAHSFSLLALSEIFDAVKKLEALST